MGFGGQQGGRVEDFRFLTGQGRYVDDIAPADALHAVFVRSPVAHAEIRALDVAAAEAMPGVRAVLTAARLCDLGVDLAMRGATVPNRDGSRGASPRRPVLAEGRVRFVGEPVACIVAATRAAALDAAEAVVVETADLPVKLDLAPGGPAIHQQAPDNVAYDWGLGDAAAVAAAMAAAAHVVQLRLEHNRVIANPMEPRGAFAEWQGGRLHLCVNGQGVWTQKAQLAAQLGLDPALVRVTNPDVGGGFGMKAMAYPEYVVISAAARMLGTPVRWICERTEAMLSDNAGRDLVARAALAFDTDLRITAYGVDIASNLGAYNSQFGQPIQSEAAARVLTGVYAIPRAAVRVRGLYTNTTQVDAYRGAGRPEANYTLERCLDEAARQLGVDPVELRLRNMVRTFPYRTVSGESYDCGDFAGVLLRLRDAAEVAGLPARRAASAARGLLRGFGIASYIEAILGDPTEAAEIAFEPDGTLRLMVGTQSNGQGHETVFARFLAERTGIPAERIRVVQGDSDLIARGGGTGGSRSVSVQTNATIAAVGTMLAAFAPFLAPAFGAEPAFDGQAFRAPGSNRSITLPEAAALARAAGRDDLLLHRAEARLAGRSYPNGAHACEIEVDPETGAVRVDRYTAVDDFGTLLAPQLVEGQVHGGVAQGIGQALCERAVHDARGQLLSASFMDYALPRADDLPMFRLVSHPVPSARNPLGMKGCGEAGTVGALAAVANALRDALAPAGVGAVDMPFTPARVWTWLREARHDRA
jgi:carbon-monoxide dehydrogenase large subunit